MDEDNICIVCYTQPVSVKLKPCEHKFCNVCTCRFIAATGFKCPKCRAIIGNILWLPNTSHAGEIMSIDDVSNNGEELLLNHYSPLEEIIPVDPNDFTRPDPHREGWVIMWSAANDRAMRLTGRPRIRQMIQTAVRRVRRRREPPE